MKMVKKYNWNIKGAVRVYSTDLFLGLVTLASDLLGTKEADFSGLTKGQRDRETTSNSVGGRQCQF